MDTQFFTQKIHNFGRLSAEKTIRIITVAGAVALFSYLPVIANADTQLRLKTVGENRIVTEGYVHSLDDWIESVEKHRRAGGTKHSDHKDPNVYIAHVGTLLFDDRDGDGYFSGFSLSVDTDIEWGHGDIYLSIYLQEQGTDKRLFHTSSAFTIYGNSESDEYGIEVELLENYPAGNYDIQIDVHDAYGYEVLDSISSEEQQNLGALPLESELAGPIYHDETVTEHVGGAGPVILVLVCGFLSIRRWRSFA